MARSDGGWRVDPLDVLPPVRLLLARAKVKDLSPLIPRSRPVAERAEVFVSAAKDLALLLPYIPSLPKRDWVSLANGLQARLAEDLSDPKFENILTLQLTSLTTLIQQGVESGRAISSLPEDILLSHEGRFWEDSAKGPPFGLEIPTPVLSDAVAVAAMCGATTEREAIAVLRKITAIPTAVVPRVGEWVAKLYPAESGRYWGSLQPDRIAEHHCAQAIARGRVSLRQVLKVASPRQQARLIAVLGRAAIAHQAAGRTEAGRELGEIINRDLELRYLFPQAIRDGAAGLPHPASVIGEFATNLTSALVDANRRHLDDLNAHADLARSLSDLAIRQGEAQRIAEALLSAKESVELYGWIVALRPEAYVSDLTRSLRVLESSLLTLGRRDEVISLMILEAEAMFRQLQMMENIREHEARLANSVHNLQALYRRWRAGV
ncbi:hypothetical protein [Streptomyces sp. CB03911]|uniref:hypothetical protein n=1 Tax=Streptomyces sp. CB03911 TaxID=1804758 RepID=UPI0018FEB871|nr:hypothetical protein [Streptomyces sp. CB03911]